MFKPEVNNDVPLTSVVGDTFCFPYLMNLFAKKKISRLSEAHFEVLDDNGDLVLQVDGSIWQLKKKRTIRDPAGLPIVTMRRKVVKLRERWTVNRGDNKDVSNHLYTVQQSHSFQLKPRLDVFIASNITENICDFHLTGSYLSESFKLHKGEQLIAEVKEKIKFGCLLGRQKFEVRVYPGVDYVFVMSLLVILNEIVTQNKNRINM